MRLTERERETLNLVACGLTSKQIAEQLTVTTKSVEDCVTRILAKTGQPNRTAAACVALKRGLIEGPEVAQ